MDIKSAKRVSIYRLGGGQPTKNKVCTFWLAGRCDRKPCGFMHRESPPPQTKQTTNSVSPSDSHHLKSSTNTWKNPNYCTPKSGKVLTKRGAESTCTSGESSQNEVLGDMKYQERDIRLTRRQTGPKRTCDEVSQHEVPSSNGRKFGRKCQEAVITANESTCDRQTVQKPLTYEVVESETKSVQKPQPKLCKYWVTGSCAHGDMCKDAHSWFCGSGFRMLTKLEGHIKAITGIALQSGSDKLFSVSKDRTLRVWDCNSGQCAGVVNVNGEVGCLISEGPWLFAGLPNAIKAWNFKTQTELTLDGPVGQVYSMVFDNDMLFAGTEDGSILAWKCGTETNIPEPVATMKGHHGGVCSLVVGANNRLYSGSMDNAIRVWDLEKLHCAQILHGHTGGVTSVICWNCYLLSASLDNTIKVWVATESGNLEVIYELKQEHGIVALCGMIDAEAKPILFCSYKDNTVGIYDLPSFNERGRLFSKGEVEVIQQIGIDGLFFTGDATGQLYVWKLLGSTTV